MPAFGNKLCTTRIEIGGTPAPHQDQCMFPTDTGTPYWTDSVTDTNFGYFGAASYSEDDGAPAFVLDGTAGSYGEIARVETGSYPLVIKSWTGPLTFLVRAWGVGSSSSINSLFGDLGDGISPGRGMAGGPDNAGASRFIIASSVTSVVSTPTTPGVYSSTPTYHDYTYIYEPSARIAEIKDSVLQSENTSGIPASRYVGSDLDFKVGNRGDLNTVHIGRVRFIFIYKKVLTQDEWEAAFNNPVYVP